MLLRYLSGKRNCGICVEKVIGVSGWKRLLRYLPEEGYCGICLEKVIAVSVWERILRCQSGKGYYGILPGNGYLQYQSGEGYCGIRLEKVIAVSGCKRLLFGKVIAVSVCGISVSAGKGYCVSDWSQMLLLYLS